VAAGAGRCGRKLEERRRNRAELGARLGIHRHRQRNAGRESRPWRSCAGCNDRRDRRPFDVADADADAWQRCCFRRRLLGFLGRRTGAFLLFIFLTANGTSSRLVAVVEKVMGE